MYICHERKIVLVAVPKTGSTTLHYTMIRALGREFFFDNTSPHLYHLYASDIDRIVGPAIRDYAVYAVVRNPYARLISLYNDFHGARGAIREASFLKFMKSGLRQRWMRDIHFQPQHRFLARAEGRCRTFSFEDGVQAAFDAIAAAHGLPPTEVGHARKGPEIGDFRRAFDAEALEIANDIYQRDFAELGYDMIAP